jgi:nickel transport system permease protein
MLRFVLRRTASLIPILVGLSLATFLLLWLDPVDPAVAWLRAAQVPPTEEAVAMARHELGLDRPLAVQYRDWLRRSARMDFGTSTLTRRPVLDELFYYLPATLQLTGAALALTILVSLPLGVLSALYRDSLLDHFCRALSYVGASIPSFWLGFLLIHVASVKLGWLPTSGRGGPTHLILPAFTLPFMFIAVFVRLIRASVLENLNHRFVLYARARGLRERWVVGKHVLKNSLLPVVTAFGMSAGSFLGGSVVVESVFAWPGLGVYTTRAIMGRDLPVVQGYILLMSAIFIICNLLVDILHASLDPRLRLGSSSS